MNSTVAYVMKHKDDSCAIELIRKLQNIIPRIIGGRDVCTMTAADLDVLLKPVQNILSEIDTEKLLQTTRVKEGGACIGNGKFVLTIHDQVQPFEKGIRYLHMKESTNCFSAGIFIFPPGAVIPLHDHPNMAVLSRVLYGDLRLKTFDIISYDSKDNDKHHKVETNGIRRWFFPKLLSTMRRDKDSDYMAFNAKLRAQENEVKLISSPEIATLYPKKENIHEFTAGMQGAAVLDVLIPPYDVNADRDCTFYEKVDANHFEKRENDLDCMCWLLSKQQPPWFQCLAGHYNNLGDEIEV